MQMLHGLQSEGNFCFNNLRDTKLQGFIEFLMEKRNNFDFVLNMG